MLGCRSFIRSWDCRITRLIRILLSRVHQRAALCSEVAALSPKLVEYCRRDIAYFNPYLGIADHVGRNNHGNQCAAAN